MQTKVDETAAGRESAQPGEHEWSAPTPVLDQFQPATSALVAHLARAVRDHHAHQHPEGGEDFYCLNLVAFMGERMGPVLRRLRDAETLTRYTAPMWIRVDELRVPESGPKWQRQWSGAGEWFDITAVVPCEVPSCEVATEFDGRCTVVAYGPHFAHTFAPAASMSVRIPAVSA